MKSARRPISVMLRRRGRKFVGKIGRGGDDLGKLAQHVLPQRRQFRRDLRLDFGQALDARAQKRLGRGVARGYACATMPSQNSNCPSRMRTILWMMATVPVSCSSCGAGASVRGSICETTPIRRFSPSDSTSATEVGRPTLKRQQSVGEQNGIAHGENGDLFRTRSWAIPARYLRPAEHPLRRRIRLRHCLSLGRFHTYRVTRAHER